MYSQSRDWLFHRPSEHTLGDFAITPGESCNVDDEAISRISRSYANAVETDLGDRGIDWLGMYGEMKADVHAGLVSNSAGEARGFLANPASNMMFYGFENIYRGQAEHSGPHHHLQSQFIYNSLLRTAEAVGTVRMEDPEIYDFSGDPPVPAAVEDLLNGLDEAFGFRIDFPNPYPNEVGFPTSRGVASYRAIHALYQVWRMLQLVGGSNRSIVEIGAGLGRNAYYARKAGIDRYTIVDIPMTSAAQAYFLARTLGSSSVRLFGETHEAPVRILPPEEFLSSTERYDLVLNVDSLPEMDSNVAKRYMRHIAKRSKTFWSVNHEYLSFTVRSIYLSEGGRLTGRFPYWLRRGYIEEVVEF